MGVYIYTAKDMITQKKQKGEVDLNSQEEVKKYLMDRNLFPVSIKKKNALNSDISFGPKGLSLKEINFFCKQFAAMFQAGVSIAKGLELCAQQSPSKKLKMHLESIHENVSHGQTLSEAVKEEGVFPEILENMIECGEAAGTLDEVLNKTIEHFDSQLGIKKKIKGALMQPIITLIVAAVAVAVIMIKVVPAFLGLLSDTGAEIPAPTKIVIAVSNFFVNSWIYLIIGIVVLVIVAMNIKRIPAARRALDWLSIRMPLTGNLTRKSLCSTFASTMSMLVESGVPMLQAMEVTRNVMGNRIAQEEMEESMEVLKRGGSLLEAIDKSTIFEAILKSMVKIGEESGQLDEMLAKISVYFKEQVEMAVDAMIELIQPVMLIGLGFIVGGIMLAVMLPTFSAATAVL